MALHSSPSPLGAPALAAAAVGRAPAAAARRSGASVAAKGGQVPLVARQGHARARMPGTRSALNNST